MSETLVLSIRILQGLRGDPAFESELRLPLPKTPEEQNVAVRRWLDFMASGLRVGASEMCATLEASQEAVEPPVSEKAPL